MVAVRFRRVGGLLVLACLLAACPAKDQVKTTQKALASKGTQPKVQDATGQGEPKVRKVPIRRAAPPAREAAKPQTRQDEPKVRKASAPQKKADKAPSLEQLRKGFELLQRRKTVAAYRWFASLFERFPQSVDVNWGLATAAFSSQPGNFEKSARHYGILLSLLKTMPKEKRFRLIRRGALEGLGVSFLALRQWSKSVDALVILTKNFPGYGPGYYHLACSYFRSGQHKKRVRPTLQKAFGLSSDLRRKYKKDPCFR